MNKNMTMRTAALAIALLATYSTSHAAPSDYTVVGASSGNPVVVGPATFGDTHFHGPEGAPGLGSTGSSNRISLESITLDPPGYFGFSTYQDSTTLSGHEFRRYQVTGFVNDPNHPTVSTTLNWYKVPTNNGIQAYYGTWTRPATGSTSQQNQAWFVGDKTGTAVPTVNTTYVATGIVNTSSTTASSPILVSGTLGLDHGFAPANLYGTLSDGTNNLTVDVDISGTAFSGTSSFNSATGTASGEFFSSGTNSSIAGIAVGTGGSYHAAFGGIKQ